MEPLDEIYQKYSQKVYLFLLGKTENANLAEELTQETFFQAVQMIQLLRILPHQVCDAADPDILQMLLHVCSYAWYVF